MTTIKQIAKYKNGNYKVAILSDGTKIRTGLKENFNPVYPESMDIKITNYCDAGCAFCHEQSTKEGTHGDLGKYTYIFEGLPRGIEIAIGGGNPLSHPDLIPFLKMLNEKGFIPNLTVNSFHIVTFRDLIEQFRREHLVYGLGISYQFGNLEKIKEMVDEDTIIHVIAGIHDYKEMQKIVDAIPNAKLLILGYKVFGRGEFIYSKIGPAIDAKIQDLYRSVYKLFREDRVICFDNLAVKQLNIKRLFTKEGWQKFYMGEDGKFTFYVDFVKSQYAVCSTAVERCSIDGLDIAQMFNHINTPL